MRMRCMSGRASTFSKLFALRFSLRPADVPSLIFSIFRGCIKHIYEDFERNASEMCTNMKEMRNLHVKL